MKLYLFAMFLMRGFVSLRSYKTAMLLRFLTMVVSIGSFYFVGKLVGFQENPYLEAYGGDYISFLIVGVLFQNYVSLALFSFSNQISNEQRGGTLEFLLTSRSSLLKIFLYASLFEFIWVSIQISTIIAISLFVLKVNLSLNILSFLILLLTIASLSGLGLMSAGVMLVTKKGDPVTWFFGTVSSFLSGVYYPVEILPFYLQRISLVLPNTYALKALRNVLINNAGIPEILPELLWLFLFLIVLTPLGIYVFHWGYTKARREGSLSEF